MNVYSYATQATSRWSKQSIGFYCYIDMCMKRAHGGANDGHVWNYADSITLPCYVFKVLNNLSPPPTYNVTLLHT